MLQRVPIDEPIVAAEADVFVLGVTSFRLCRGEKLKEILKDSLISPKEES